MAKKIPDEIVEAEVFPEISFAEAEVQQVADFVNYCYKHGEFKMQMADTKKINTMLSNMHTHITKLEKYIFEHRRVITAKKAAG